MTTRKLSTRERTLLIVLVTAALGLAWWGGRGAPLRATLATAWDARDRADVAFEAAGASLASVGDPARLAREQTSLQMQLTALSEERLALGEALAALELRFADANGVRDLTLALSSLAEEHGLEMVEHRRHDEDPAAIPALQRRLCAGQPYRRPLHRLVVRSDYTGLVGFVTALASLPGRVVLVRLSALRDDAASDGRPLTSTLLLAL